MSARQLNKKRKGRPISNRERTVTTLTEDPNTPYLVPTPTEDPPGTNIMSPPFSVASSAGANQSNISPSAFPFSGSYGFAYNNYIPPLHPTVHSQQAQQFFQSSQAQSVLPPGQSDLEVLENLKKSIKEGQHEFYRAIPQPDVLASMYLGPVHESQVPPHPEQVSDQNLAFSKSPLYDNDGTHSDLLATNTGSISVSSSMDSTKRGPHTPRTYADDGGNASSNLKSIVEPTSVQAPPLLSSSTISSSTADPPRLSQAHQTSPIEVVPGRRLSDNKDIKSDPASAVPRSRSDSRRHSLEMKPVADSSGRTSSVVPSPPQASTRFESLARADSLGEQSSQDHISGRLRSGTDVSGSSDPIHRSTTGPQDTTSHKVPFEASPSWQSRQRPPPRDDHPPPRGPPDPVDRVGNPDVNASSNDVTNRFSGPIDSRYIDWDRDRDSDWDQRVRERDRDFDHRSRMDFRRPPVEPRRLHSKYHTMTPARSFDDKLSPSDKPPDHSSVTLLTAASSNRDGRPAAPHHSADIRSASVAPLEDHPIRTPASDDRRAWPSPAQDHYPSRDRPVRPVNAVPIRTDKDFQRPSGTKPQDKGLQSAIPVEQRSSRPPPSLQDRLSQPPQSTRSESSHATRRPSLEERLSDAPTPATDLTRSISSEDALARSKQPHGSEQGRVGEERGRVSEVSGQTSPNVRERNPLPEGRPTHPGAADQDRHGKPVANRYDVIPQRTTPAVREDQRALVRKTSSPPPPRLPLPPPSYRPGLDTPRERPDPRNGNGHRIPSDRYTDGGRRPDGVDVEGSQRFHDSRLLYNRPLSPPSATDLARDRGRAPYPHLPSTSPRPIGEAPPYDVHVDRRYTTPADRREWGYSQQLPYADRRREWSPGEGELYRKSQPQRFERDAPPPPPRAPGWETREERERRSTFPANPPSARSSFDLAPHRSLGSRLTDDYIGSGSSASGALEDRFDRLRYYPPGSSPPPFSRVRQRSPSPIERRLPPTGSVDNMRPPMKRAREDIPYPPGYYSPPREPTRRTSHMSEYTQRVATPPPSSAGSYYDAIHRPPPTTGSSVGQERSYMGSREGGPGLDYIPVSSSYDRRSPPPSRFPGPPQGYGRGGYGRGDPRDDRRYNMAPPPPRTA